MITPNCARYPNDPQRKDSQDKVVKDWRAAGDCAHFVQFYCGDAELMEPLTEYVADGIWQSDRVLVVATAEHRATLAARLQGKGVDVSSALHTRQLLMVDAAETLERFMVADRPDRVLFEAHIGAMVQSKTRGGRRLRAFGEMVALLWDRGNRRGALELERLWCDLSRQCAFSLFCSYPMRTSDSLDSEYALADVSAVHDCVIRTED